MSSLCLYFILFSFQIDIVSLTKHLSLLTKNLKTHEFEVKYINYCHEIMYASNSTKHKIKNIRYSKTKHCKRCK